LFGDQSGVGGVMFLDAYPQDWPTLEVDIVNPHYGPYHLQGETPGDWHSPIPVFFLTVAPGQRFEFAVAAPADVAPQFVDRAQNLLKGAADEAGLGGKSGVGYGYFDAV
jgi:CRISPR-associated protein Cmr6